MKKLRPIYAAAAVLLLALFFIVEALTAQHLSYHFGFVGYGGTFRYHDLRVIGIPVYWFMLLCGFALTFPLSWFRRAHYGLSKAQALLFPVLFLLISYTGAKMLFILEDTAAFQRNGFSFSGVSLFGAIYLVYLTVPLIALIIRKNIFLMYDFFTPFGIVLLACVRTGCFLNGCCGAETIWRGTNPIVLPVQLMEVICDLLILELCAYVEQKQKHRGNMYPVFLLTYSICRFLLEFLRETPKTALHLSHGQWFAVAAVGMAAILFGICRFAGSKAAVAPSAN